MQTTTMLALILAVAIIAGATTAIDVQAARGGGNSGNVEDNGNDDNPGGMGNCNNSPDDCERQPDRVGNDEDDTDAPRDGPGGAGGSAGDPGQEEDDGEGEANCWGKVSSELGKIQDHPAHASDPVPGDTDNETPREGVGNQQEGHPSDHADTVGGFLGIDEDCVN